MATSIDQMLESFNEPGRSAFSFEFDLVPGHSLLRRHVQRGPNGQHRMVEVHKSMAANQWAIIIWDFDRESRTLVYQDEVTTISVYAQLCQVTFEQWAADVIAGPEE